MAENHREMGEKFAQHLLDHSAPRNGAYVEVEFAPPDHMQKYGEKSFWNRFTLWKAFWVDRLKILTGYSCKAVVMEQSTPGRFHLHCIYRVSSVQEFLGSVAKIRLGAPNKKGDYTDHLSTAVYKIMTRNHLMERVKYLAKDVKTFREDGYEPVISARGRLKELLNEAIDATTGVTTEPDQW